MTCVTILYSLFYRVALLNLKMLGEQVDLSSMHQYY